MRAPKFPHVTVRLVGEDGNAFAIIGRVQRALRRAGEDDGARAFTSEAKEQPSYDDLLRLCMDTVEVE